MKKLIRKLEDIVVIITFLEAGEYETTKVLIVEKDIAVTKGEETARSLQKFMLEENHGT